MILEVGTETLELLSESLDLDLLVEQSEALAEAIDSPQGCPKKELLDGLHNFIVELSICLQRDNQ